MSVSKLRTIHVIIIGSVACLVVIVGLYFLLIKKSTEEIGVLETRLQTAEQTAMRRSSVEANLAAVRQTNIDITSKYERYLTSKMPPISFENRAQGMIALWREQAETLGPLLQNWPNKTGVRLASGVQVPAAPVDPNSIDTTLIRIPIGTFQVTGDFRSILSHISQWNNFNRLVQIEQPISLSGQSPNLSAQYNLSVLIFPRGETGPTIPMAGSGQAGMGGFSGGPAMMPPPGGMSPTPGMTPPPAGVPNMSPAPPPAPTARPGTPSGPINP